MMEPKCWYMHCYTPTCLPGFPASTYYSSDLKDVAIAMRDVLLSNTDIERVEVTMKKGNAQSPQPLWQENAREYRRSLGER